MPTANKFACLQEVAATRKQVSAGLPKKAGKKPEKPEPTTTGPKPGIKQLAQATKTGAPKKPAATAGSAAALSDAPSDLRAAAEFNRKKAEELRAKKAAEEEVRQRKAAEIEAKRTVEERAQAEAAAVKDAADETQAEVQGESDAQKEAAEEAAAIAAERAPKKKEEEEPAKPVMTMDAFNKQREESRFAIGSKATRKANSAGLESLQKLAQEDVELVIKKTQPAKPVSTKPKKGAAAPAPKSEKKEKAAKIDLSQFADYDAARNNSSRGGGFRGRGDGAPRTEGRGRGGDAPRAEGRGRGGDAPRAEGRGRGGDGAPRAEGRGRGGEGRGRGGEGFRGGYRGGAGAGARMPSFDDKRAFPTL